MITVYCGVESSVSSSCGRSPQTTFFFGDFSGVGDVDCGGDVKGTCGFFALEMGDGLLSESTIISLFFFSPLFLFVVGFLLSFNSSEFGVALVLRMDSSWVFLLLLFAAVDLGDDCGVESSCESDSSELGELKTPSKDDDEDDE